MGVSQVIQHSTYLIRHFCSKHAWLFSSLIRPCHQSLRDVPGGAVVTTTPLNAFNAFLAWAMSIAMADFLAHGVIFVSSASIVGHVCRFMTHAERGSQLVEDFL